MGYNLEGINQLGTIRVLSEKYNITDMDTEILDNKKYITNYLPFLSQESICGYWTGLMPFLIMVN